MLSGLLILILILLLGIVIIVIKQKPSTRPISNVKTTVPSPSHSLFKETKIELTKTGFSPRIVTIKVNEGISWTNKSGVKATINSADHPTHKKFPEINLGEFGNNISLTHIFTKSGRYDFHNHYNPLQSGTIIVE